MRAQGEADAVLIRVHADAKANQIIRLSASGVVLQYRAIEKWDGKLPMMQGSGQLPLLTFDATKLAGSDAEREKQLQALLAQTAPSAQPAPPAAPVPQPAPAPAPPAAPVPAPSATPK